MSQLLSAEDLTRELHRIGEERYHHLHPFHQLMHEGKLRSELEKNPNDQIALVRHP